MIAATSLGALVTRAIVSLAIVLAIVAVAYLVARRRAGGAAPVSNGSERSLFGRRRSAPPAIEVVGRVGLTRGTAAVAVRFGERVVLIAAAEQGPSNVITDMPAAEWDEFRTVREPIEPAVVPGAAPGASVIEPRPSFVEALRQATARHA